MRISAWSSDVCSSDLRAWRAFRCRRSRLEAVALEVREHVLPRSMVARGTGDRRDPAPVLRDDVVVAARRLADLVALLLERLEQLAQFLVHRDLLGGYVVLTYVTLHPDRRGRYPPR